MMRDFLQIASKNMYNCALLLLCITAAECRLGSPVCWKNCSN